MAERNVTVRLRAVTDQYKKAMGEASAATSGLVAKAGGMEAIGGKMKSVGGTLTKSVTLPMVALGGVAAKLSLDFESTFSRMVGLAGVAADEVDGLKSSVLKLAGDTTRPPQELAEALYFIRSAGLEGQDALDALEMSAKGAAAGLGDTVTVADAVTSAMNAYGSNVLSAAEATDVLAATAEQGKVEASALAGQFGRLLPVSSELGISFGQVGGAMGYLTRSSGSAELAATQLGAVMSKILKPSEQGAKALASIGMTTDDLRASIADRGLLGTLEMLRNSLGDAGFNKFLEDQQAVAGALTLTGKNFEDAQATIDAVGDSAGKTEEAFAAFAETAGFKNKQAFAELQAALISIGDVLVPLIADVASFASAFLGAFNSLPGPLKTAAIGFGLVLAVAGPLAWLGGTIATNWALLGVAFDKAAISAYTLAGSLATVAAVAGALVAVGFAVKAVADEMRKAGEDADGMARGIIGSFDASKASAAEFEAEFQRLQAARDAFQNAANNATNPLLIERHKQAAAAIDEEVQAMASLGAEAGLLMDGLGMTADEALAFVTDADKMAAATDNAAGEFDVAAAEAANLAGEVEDTAKAFQELADELAAQFDPLFGAQDAMMDLAEAQQAAADAARDHGKGSKEAADANDKVVRAALANEQAQLKLRSAIEAGDVSLDDSIATLNRWVAEGHITQEQADAAAWSFGGLADKANSIPRSVSISVTANTDSVHAELRAAANAVNAFNSSNGTSLNVYRGAGAVPKRKAAGGPIYRALGGPSGTDTVPAWLTPGEFVLSADVVNAIKQGNPTAGLPALARAGGGSSGDTFVINASALTGRQVARDVVDAIESAKRTGA